MPALKGQTILVLGGWGLVGRAICFELLKENPKKLVVCSLKEKEAKDAVLDLAQEIGFLTETGKTRINTKLVPEWGDLFARVEFKDMDARAVTDTATLDRIIDDTFNDLSTVDVSKNYLHRLVTRYKPDVVIDAVNTATGVAYRDVYASVLDLRLRMRDVEALDPADPAYAEAVRAMMTSARIQIASNYLPRLIRHVQILYNAMKTAGTRSYFKIGTTGTGGMGLNIPYTHSEEKPSQKLLSKSAVAGAHSLLLFLMNNTPGFAFTMEVKPAAAIAWKDIDRGEIRKAGKPIELFDCDLRAPFDVTKSVDLVAAGDARIRPIGEPLKAVYINTGENGLFSAAEFEAITTAGQMEYVTPEEIAKNVKEELLGGNTGFDIIGMLSNSVMKSTYRAGVMREIALERLRDMQAETGDESIAFELLGPPRLSKLLYEAHLLRRVYGDIATATKADPAAMSSDLERLVRRDKTLRARIISIGIPILLPDGKSMLRGPNIVIPPFRGRNTVELDAKRFDRYAHDGWVDLRVANMKHWRERLARLAAEMESMDWKQTQSVMGTSSRVHRKRYQITVRGKTVLNVGEIVGWIFNEEEEGSRKTYSHPRVRPPRA
ncbi:MAG: short-chain dehydrogenase [Deltaproteobacteria bacterium]|nr:short-chain dehydrogenase [Deltaproteobacteria bacterium]